VYNGLDGQATLGKAVRRDAIVENDCAFFLEGLEGVIQALFPVSGLLLLLLVLVLLVRKADEEGGHVGGGARKEGWWWRRR
jgi:hypothetical protein